MRCKRVPMAANSVRMCLRALHLQTVSFFSGLTDKPAGSSADSSDIAEDLVVAVASRLQKDVRYAESYTFFLDLIGAFALTVG